MATEVKYLIAQYLSDPLRKEPRNIGVIAQRGGRVAARFLGEDHARNIDGRKLRSFRYPDVYRQWVQFWRDESARNEELESLVAFNETHYQLIRGGKVFDVGQDPVEAVVAYIFTRFVSEEGFAGAVESREEAAVPHQSFSEEIETMLSGRNLLGDTPESLLVPHPIVRKRAVHGRSRALHTPDFVQENGRLFVMETLDLTGPQPSRIREHAGFSAFMFLDLKGARGDDAVDSIAIVRTSEKARENDHVVNALWMLEAEARIVDWSSPGDQEQFLREREKVAEGEGSDGPQFA